MDEDHYYTDHEDHDSTDSHCLFPVPLDLRRRPGWIGQQLRHVGLRHAHWCIGLSVVRLKVTISRPQHCHGISGGGLPCSQFLHLRASSFDYPPTRFRVSELFDQVLDIGRQKFTKVTA